MTGADEVSAADGSEGYDGGAAGLTRPKRVGIGAGTIIRLRNFGNIMV